MTHLRYFTFNPSTGKNNLDLVVFYQKQIKIIYVMNNGEFSWSVQKDKTVFFKKLSFGELKDELVEKISKKNMKKKL